MPHWFPYVVIGLCAVFIVACMVYTVITDKPDGYDEKEGKK